MKTKAKCLNQGKQAEMQAHLVQIWFEVGEGSEQSDAEELLAGLFETSKGLLIDVAHMPAPTPARAPVAAPTPRTSPSRKQKKNQKRRRKQAARVATTATSVEEAPQSTMPTEKAVVVVTSPTPLVDFSDLLEDSNSVGKDVWLISQAQRTWDLRCEGDAVVDAPPPEKAVGKSGRTRAARNYKQMASSGHL